MAASVPFPFAYVESGMDRKQRARYMRFCLWLTKRPQSRFGFWQYITQGKPRELRLMEAMAIKCYRASDQP